MLQLEGKERAVTVLFYFLAKTLTKWWPIIDKVEMPELSCFTAEIGNRRLRENGTLE